MKKIFRVLFVVVLFQIVISRSEATRPLEEMSTVPPQSCFPIDIWGRIFEYCPFETLLQLSHTNKFYLRNIKFDVNCNLDLTGEPNNPNGFTKEDQTRLNSKNERYASCISLLADRKALKSCSINFDNPYPAFNPDGPQNFFLFLEKTDIRSLNIGTKIETDFSSFANPWLEKDFVNLTQPFKDFLTKTTTLQQLDVFGSSFTLQNTVLLLAQSTSLTDLSLECDLCRVTGGEGTAEAFFKLLQQNTTLKRLNVRGNDLTQDFVFEMLAHNNTLQELSVSLNERPQERFSDENIEALCNAVKKNISLTKLDLSGHKFSNKLLTRIGTECSGLKDGRVPLTLILMDNSFSSNGIKVVGGVVTINYSRYEDLDEISGEDSNEDSNNE
jgi:hypothetical protein